MDAGDIPTPLEVDTLQGQVLKTDASLDSGAKGDLQIEEAEFKMDENWEPVEQEEQCYEFKAQAAAERTQAESPVKIRRGKRKRSSVYDEDGRQE